MLKKPSNADELTCSSCRLPKTSLKNDFHCGICHCLLCKECAQFLEDEFFSFLKIVPEDLKHPTYCGPCYDQKVASSMESYLEIIERAKKISIFYKNERNVPVIRRSNVKLSVHDCPDRKETLLRLAFLAAEQSYSVLVGVELSSKKILIAGYQKSTWSATGFPAQATPNF